MEDRVFVISVAVRFISVPFQLASFICHVNLVKVKSLFVRIRISRLIYEGKKKLCESQCGHFFQLGRLSLIRIEVTLMVCEYFLGFWHFIPMLWDHGMAIRMRYEFSWIKNCQGKVYKVDERMLNISRLKYYRLNGDLGEKLHLNIYFFLIILCCDNNTEMIVIRSNSSLLSGS